MKRRTKTAKLDDLLKRAEQAEAALAENLARSNALGEEHKRLARERAGEPTAVELLEIEHRLRQIEREHDQLEVEAQHLGAEATRLRTAYSQAARRVREARETLERLRETPERFDEYSRWQVSQIRQLCNAAIKEMTS